MIHETVVDKSLNRLMSHFGARVVLRPPASAADLGRLEAIVGPLPRDYGILMMTCSGLRIAMADRGGEFRLWSVNDAADTCGQPRAPSIPAGFVPLCSNPDGCVDWLILGDEALQGAVLRWSPGMHGEEILASSIGHYFNNWTRHLTAAFDRRGLRAIRPVPAFDGEFCAKTDPQLFRLRRSGQVRDTMAELELRASAGEDFE